MAAVTAFFERTDLHKTAKPYSWDGPDGQSFPKSNFAMKDMEVSFRQILLEKKTEDVDECAMQA